MTYGLRPSLKFQTLIPIIKKNITLSARYNANPPLVAIVDIIVVVLPRLLELVLFFG